jgi:hypothetical protein
MGVIAGRVGGVGGDRHRACRHDRKIGDAEFPPVFADQHHPVAGEHTIGAQPRRQSRDLARHAGPAVRRPLAVRLGPQERPVAKLRGAGKEHRGEARKMFELPH